jgi:cell division protein FtsZ
MSSAGSAIMGIGEGYGENRVATAAHNAINSPLMEVPMIGAKRVLFNVTGSSKLGIHEVEEAAHIINNASDSDVNMIWGQVFDPDMEDMVRITIIATDFEESAAFAARDSMGGGLPERAAGSEFQKSPSMSIAGTAVASPGQPPAQANNIKGAEPLQGRSDMGETAVLFSGFPDEENLFGQGGQQDQLDIPSYLRKGKR